MQNKVLHVLSAWHREIKKDWYVNDTIVYNFYEFICL